MKDCDVLKSRDQQQSLFPKVASILSAIPGLFSKVTLQGHQGLRPDFLLLGYRQVWNPVADF
jgi:hypothetical protein